MFCVKLHLSTCFIKEFHDDADDDDDVTDMTYNAFGGTLNLNQSF